jgi:TonB-dependent receptor
MATASPDRAFAFDVLPAELIKKAVVHKTGEADLPAGGIGGTVNIITATPDDFDGFHASFSAAGVKNYPIGSGGSSNVTPKVDFLIGDNNSDHTFGWLVSGLYYKRNNLLQAVETDGWAMGLDLSNINPNLTSVSLPQSVQYDYWPQKITRRSLNVALSWHPTSKLSMEFNALVTNFRQNGREDALGLYTEPDDFKSIEVDQHGTAVRAVRRADGVMSNDYIEISAPVNSKNEQAGVHLVWDATSSTEVGADASVSKAWDKPDGKGYFMVIGTRNKGVNPVLINNGPGKMPSYNGLISTTDVDDLRAHYFGTAAEAAGNGNVSNRISTLKAQLKTEFDSGIVQNMKAGVVASNRTKNEDRWQMPGSVGNGFGAVEYNGYVASVPANAVDARAGHFGDIADNASPGGPTSWVIYDVNKALQYYASPAAYNQLPNPAVFKAQLDANGGGFDANFNPQTLSDIGEHVRSAYASLTLGSMTVVTPWKLNLGLRYTKTVTSSSGYIAPLLGLKKNPNDPTVVVSRFGQPAVVSQTGSYHNWLPSLNLKLNLTDNLLFRFSASKTLTRPDLGTLALAQYWSFAEPELQLSTGNVNIKPYTSVNYDAGLGWYFNRASYVSVDLFHKKVSDFTTTITTIEDIHGFPFHVTRPVNLNTAKVKGAEFTFNYQILGSQTFLDGFGIATNYTYASSNATISPEIIATTGKFAIPGMGNSYNASLYYQRYGLQARLAWNWRGHYLSTLANDEGYPGTTKPYGQLDFSASYKVTSHFSVFLNATNLNGEKIARYQIYQNMMNYVEANGRTFTLGVRGSW